MEENRENNNEERQREREKLMDKRRAYSKNYYSKNKDKIYEKVNKKLKCNECNIDLPYYARYKHNKTKKHIRNVEKNEATKNNEILNEINKKLSLIIQNELKNI